MVFFLILVSTKVSIPDPRASEAIVFKDFFVAGLWMPPHPVLVDILRKFRVQLH
jgi:hypothetical protein